MTNIEKIAKLNDQLRQTGINGKIVLTKGVANLSLRTRERALLIVRTYDNFSEDNDPYGEHDFGSFTIEGNKFFWKIDYYDNEYKFGSEVPWDETNTKRVLTVMLASEY